MNFYSDSILQIMTVYVRDTRKISIYFLDSKITVEGDCRHEIKRPPWKKSNDKPRQHIKKQRRYFTIKGLYGQSYGFSSSHVQMWKLDNKKG